MPFGKTQMSMITRCPGCGTSFRVGADQLEARGGRVRCGRCSVVFDARAALLSDTASSAKEDEFAAALESEMHRAGATTDARVASPEAGEGAAQTASPEFDFGPRVGKRRSRLWGLASVLLLFTLAAQAGYRYRGELALLVPEAKPVIEQLCARLSCDVPLPRRAEFMSIETSDLQADAANPSVMVLSATLRNRAAFAQALPALELTLTSAQDEPVARRVLMPRDYAPRGMRLDAGFSGNSEIPVRVFIESGALKATGYRVYLFYP